MAKAQEVERGSIGALMLRHGAVDGRRRVALGRAAGLDERSTSALTRVLVAGELTVAELARQVDCPIAEAAALLEALEVAGYVRCARAAPGGEAVFAATREGAAALRPQPLDQEALDGELLEVVSRFVRQIVAVTEREVERLSTVPLGWQPGSEAG